VIDGLVSRANEIRLGLDSTTDMGPLISEVRRDRVSGYVHSGVEDGATRRRRRCRTW